MKVVIDTNVLLAGLLKDSTVRKILISKKLNFFLPEYSLYELAKYKDEICQRAGYTLDELEELTTKLLENIRLVKKEEIEKEMEIAQDIMKNIDIKDSPFVATCLSIKADGIWSFDKDFTFQNKIKVIITVDLIKTIK